MVTNSNQRGHKFYPFDSHSTDDWLNKIDLELDKLGIKQKNWEIADVLSISPFIHRHDHPQDHKPLPSYRPGWEMGASIAFESGTEMNRMAAALLREGAKALRFTDLHSGSKEYLRKLFISGKLRGIPTSIFPESGSAARFLRTVLDWFEDIDLEPKHFNISLPWRQIRSELETIHVNALPKISQFKYVVDVDPQVDDVVEELTHYLLSANKALIFFHNKGILKDLSDPLQFSVKSDERILVNIAKIRALKITCSKILSVWRMPVSIPFIEVCLEGSNEDVPANLVPMTSHALSSGIAGADRIIVNHHAQDKDLTTRPLLSLRMQQLLQLEGHLDWVEDPVAGSYFIDKLTDKLALAAWTNFQKRSTL